MATLLIVKSIAIFTTIHALDQISVYSKLDYVDVMMMCNAEILISQGVTLITPGNANPNAILPVRPALALALQMNA